MSRPLRLVGLAVLLGACAADPGRAMTDGVRAADRGPAVIALESPAGRTFEAELMIRPEDRALGLMFRPSLPENRVLLFVFDAPGFHSIWMKNCRFPIDIVWLDGARKVVHVAEKVPPCRSEDCPSYTPMRRADYVVEMNAGQARREKYAVGATVEFTLPR